MKILEEIDDKVIFNKDYNWHSKHFFVRRATRAVLLDNDWNVYLMYLKARGIYKLPGGGVEMNETILDGLKREVKEEAGVEFNVIDEIGATVETRYDDGMETGLFQISYSYLVKIKGEKLLQEFTQSELDEGASPIWLTLDEAIKKFENYNLPDYESHFIKHRELNVLKEAQKLIKEKNLR